MRNSSRHWFVSTLTAVALSFAAASNAETSGRDGVGITVTSIADSGPGSLRQALVDANDGDTITFSTPPAPGGSAATSTISLTSGSLVVTKNVNISGPGADVLTITRGSGTFRILHISPARTVTIAGLTIANGLTSGGTGAGIYNDHASLTVDGCTLRANTAAAYGGGIANDGTSTGATLLVRNCTFTGNGAMQQGGSAIDNDGSGGGNARLMVVNSTFSGNSGSNGGAGIYNLGGTLTVANSTLYRNAPGNIVSANTGTLTVGNTILKAPTGGLNIRSAQSGAVTTRGYNLSDDNAGGFFTAASDQINTDPILGPLKDNGGPTLTHAPLSSSPAIDRGNDIDTAGRDQRGLHRPVTYDNTIAPPAGGNRSDIGAVELPPGVLPTSAFSRKAHSAAGTFDINLPLSGVVGVECRSGGATNQHQVMITFASSITVSSAVVNDGTGSVESVAGSGTNAVTLNLSGVADAQLITLALLDVDNGVSSGDVGVRMAMLLGDTNNNGSVTASDIAQAKSESGTPVTSGNFRQDVTANGTVNASDIGLVKSRSGSSLP